MLPLTGRVVMTGGFVLVVLYGFGDCHRHSDSPVNDPGHDTRQPDEGPGHDESNEAQHIKEHYKEVADLNFDVMRKNEWFFHYFKIHDFDGNTFLDGLELFEAMSDHHGESLDEYYSRPENSHMSLNDRAQEEFQHFTERIDELLAKHDTNLDGYLSYAEYSSGASEFLHF